MPRPWVETTAQAVAETRDRLEPVSSKASLLPRQSRSGPPWTGGGSSLGSGCHGPGDRRKARMPLPARVAHAAETRRCGPSGSRRRSPVTRGLAAMPAPFCCPAHWRKVASPSAQAALDCPNCVRLRPLRGAVVQCSWIEAPAPRIEAPMASASSVSAPRNSSHKFEVSCPACATWPYMAVILSISGS